nr:MAG TPA: hypothetical protein [Bacteriophage sp.]
MLLKFRVVLHILISRNMINLYYLNKPQVAMKHKT